MAVVYDFNEMRMKVKEKEIYKAEENLEMSNEEKMYYIINNAIAVVLMSLEEDGLDSDHPLINLMIPELATVIEKYVSKLMMVKSQ